MKVFSSLIVFVISCLPMATVNAQVNPEWLRYPMVSPDGNQIAFVYKGDIYTVGVDGGDAKRLTFQSKMDLQPIWSPDGMKIAFASVCVV